MLNLAGPCQQFIGGQPLSNESMNINLDIDNLDFIHLDFHHLETLVHKLPNSREKRKEFLRNKLEWICCRVHVIGSVHWKASGLSLRPQVSGRCNAVSVKNYCKDIETKC